MKVYISADIEGITGVTHWDEAMGNSSEAQRSKSQMTKEVSAACIGACEAGVQEILVKDAHGSGRNIDIGGLPMNTKVHRGWSLGPLAMMEGLDESFDCVLFIGYHSGANMGGNPLAHTFSNSKFQEIKLNGELVSEFDLNAMIASYFKVPVVFLSGDESLCNHAKKSHTHIQTVAVLKGMGDSAISLHPEQSVIHIREGVEKTLKDNPFKVQTLPASFDFEITFKEAKLAYRASHYPGVELASPKTIFYKTDDYMSFLKMFMFI